MKTRKQLTALVATVHAGTSSVQCTFQPEDDDAKTGRVYTYLCSRDLASQLKPNDAVVVTSKSDQHSTCYVRSVNLDCTPDLDENLTYEWVACKLPTRIAAKVALDSVVDMMLDAQQRQAKRAVLDALGLDDQTMVSMGLLLPAADPALALDDVIDDGDKVV